MLKASENSLCSYVKFSSFFYGWNSYIKDLPNLDGIKGLPVFYAATFYLGNSGLYILMITLLSLILTSLIGNIFALSRLLYSLSQNKIISTRFSVISKNNSPENAVWLIAAV
ncbi:amino acid permease [Treponema sp.]|uniref:amino acid permease n=1 Tax=Treponema sp. TaxID=166 RepID=UPI003890A784